MPLKLKPVPLGAICKMVRAAVPELLRRSESVFLDPVWTEPKFKLVGFAVTCLPPGPLPLSGILSVRLGALLVIARLPLNEPLDCGEKVTL
jgi:hypothetical protein